MSLLERVKLFLKFYSIINCFIDNARGTLRFVQDMDFQYGEIENHKAECC